MEKVKYCALIPAENPARQGKPVNILLVAENLTREDLVHRVRIYGNCGDGWTLLLSQDRELPAGEHAHLYFQIPEACFLPSFWQGQEVEEMELLASDHPPKPEDRGELIFVQ